MSDLFKKIRYGLGVLILFIFAFFFSNSPLTDSVSQESAQSEVNEQSYSVEAEAESVEEERAEAESVEKERAEAESVEEERAEAEQVQAVSAEAEQVEKEQAETEAEGYGLTEAEREADMQAASEVVSEDGSYTSKDEVALYLHLYHHLPSNYITKDEAKELGWISSKGNLWDVAPGKSIGGSRFGNYERQLPDAKNRHYYECDIDFDGQYRNASRIIYSDDGLVFYTEDHYETFEQLY